MSERPTNLRLIRESQVYFNEVLIQSVQASLDTEHPKKFYQEFFPKHLRAMFTIAELIVNTEPKAKDADQDIIALSIIFHDIGYMTGDKDRDPDHAVRSENEARRVLTELNANPETIDAVCHCVRSHRNKPDYPPKTIEAQVLIAADAAAHMIHDAYTTKEVPHAKQKHSQEKLERDYRDIQQFPYLLELFTPVYEWWKEELANNF